MSHWGLIPPRADSVVSQSRNRPAALWESALLWPYRVITLPISLVRMGVGATVVGLEKSRALRTIGRLLGPRTGPFGMLFEFRAGGLSGLGGGLTAEHDAFLGAGNSFRAGASSTVKADHRVNLGLRVRGVGGHATEIGAGLRVRSNARYFGLGPGARSIDESFYRSSTVWLGLSHRRQLGRGVFLEWDGLWSRVDASGPRSGEAPALADRFAAMLPLGYDAASDAVAVGLTLGHGDATETGRPNRGGIRRVRANLSRGVGGDRATFMTYRGELQQFVRLWYPDHVLALRGYLSWLDQLGSHPIPFQRYLTNDDPDLLRGYRDFRWRGRGLVALNGEYRWPLWALNYPEGPQAHLYLLGDLGQVFDRFDDITGDNLTWSVGGGLRLLGRGGLVGRIELARSSEEWVLRIRGDQVFQFAKAGLLYSRTPVPAR